MSKKLIFSSGAEVNFNGCYSKSDYAQGAQRDILDFRFDPGEITLDEVDALFSAAECAVLTIQETGTKTVTKLVPVLDDEGNPVTDEYGNELSESVEKEVEYTEEFVYENYGLRIGLSKQLFTLATENGREDVEQISVKMGQFTYTEMQVASLTDTVDILVMESLMV